MIHKQVFLTILFCAIAQGAANPQTLSVVMCNGAGATLANIALNTIDNAHISYHAAWVSKKIKQRSMVKKATYVAVAGVIGYQFFTLYQHFFNGNNGYDGVSCDCKEQNKNNAVGKQLGWKDWSCEKVMAIKKWFCSGKTWYSVGSFGLQLVSEVLVAQAVESFRRSAMSDESIGWFVLEHAPFIRTVELLKVSGHDLERPVDDANIEHMRSVFISDMNQFVGQIEKILGYMQYRYLTYLKDEKKDVARQCYEIIILLKEQTIQFIQKVDQMLAVNTYAGLLRLVDSYDFILEQHCERFADREQSRWIDVRRMQQMIDEARERGICLYLPQ